MDHIDSLNERVEEQEEKLEKHEKVIGDILKTLQTQQRPSVPEKEVKTTNVAEQCPGGVCAVPLDGMSSFIQSFPTMSLPIPFMTFGHDTKEVDSGQVQEVFEEESENEEEVEEVVAASAPVVLEPIVENLEESEPQLEKVEVKDKKKKRKKKKNNNSMADIDKELESELSELFKEEILNS